ncbi:MAG: radical SAM protein [Elusimicrobia bacterium]|nr:radical SAM protein [Elusimicrobiota bacterium]
MLDITKLWCGVETPSVKLRYGSAGGKEAAGARRPIVVWSSTKRCNLKCVHCYTDSTGELDSGELTTAQAKALIEDVAAMGVSALLFSGGEPLTRGDFFELASFASSKGIRVTLSTNGTLINQETAKKIKSLGVTYVGISFDGIGAVNDRFRGVPGAFESALKGLRNLKAVGQKTGLRFTLTRHNAENLEKIFDFIESEEIPRACFYHLVYSGRGGAIAKDDLSHAESRLAMDTIMRRTEKLAKKERPTEILTVDNPCDGVYLYLKLLKRDPERARAVLEVLKWNGGGANGSGVTLSNIDWKGNIHPDQFWQDLTIANIRNTPFSKVWTEGKHPALAGLRNRLPLLKGRCGYCAWAYVCGGGFRVRALRATGDMWEADPACYLTDEEITAMENRCQR